MKNPNYTYFMDIYPYALAKIDDINLNKLLSKNPALLYRRLWSYMMNAIPKFTSPKGMDELLIYVRPVFKDNSFTADGIAATFDTKITEPDMACISVGDMVVNCYDSTAEEPDTSMYDPVMGIITFDVAPTEGTEIEVDFYTDGYFIKIKPYNTYIATISQILGSCIELMWFTRVANNWLRMAPKAKDKNFKIDSSWNTQKSDDGRIQAITQSLNTEMREFELMLENKRIVKSQDQVVSVIGG